MTAFGKMLVDAIRKAGLNQKQFAAKVGTEPSAVSDVIHGHRKIPLKHLEKWASALGLTGKERDRFLDEAHIARSHQWVQSVVRELRGDPRVVYKPHVRRSRLSERDED